MLVRSMVGIAFGMTTVVEKVALPKDPGQAAFCDISDQIGCTPARVVGTVVRSGLDVTIVAGWTLLIAGMLSVRIAL
jgi:hypothetical protein